MALREEDMAAFDEGRRLVVRERVEKSLKTAEFVAGVIELFGPVMADTLTVLVGGEARHTDADEANYLTLRDVAGDDDDEAYGPGHPDPQ